MIFVRILLVTYLGQKCFVRWNSKDSSLFSVQNGVRQGAVLSPILFSLYVNDLIEVLRASGLGCHVGNMYFGIVAYADDILLLAPRRDVLQRMVNISEQYMINHKINFSPTKTKCLYFGSNRDTVKKIVVAGSDIDWSRHAVHLGMTLSDGGSMDQDVKVKRAIFIDGCHDLLEEFGRTHPEVQSKLLTLYNASCYGSNTWNLYVDWTKKLFTSWNVDLKEIWKLPYQTHRYFFEHLTPCRHLKVLLIKRFLKFVKSITDGQKSSCKLLLRTVAGNVNSTTGKNLRNIELEVGSEMNLENQKLDVDKVCDQIHFETVPDGNMWRIDAAKELSLVKSKHLFVDGFTNDEIEEMIKFICISR